MNTLEQMKEIEGIIKRLTPDDLEEKAIEVARYNIPYSCATDCVDYSFRYYDYNGICVCYVTKNDEIYWGNVDEIGNYEDDQNPSDDGWWDIDEEALATLRNHIVDP